MGLIRAIIRIPTYIWIIAFGAYMYLQYNSWQTKDYKGLLDNLAATETELEELATKNKASERFEKEKQEKLMEIQKMAEELNKALDKLPKASDIPLILSSFADISDRVGLEFSRFEPGQSVKSSNPYFMETPIKVELKGNFIQIMSFLDEVSHLKRIIVGKSLSLKGQKNDSTKKTDSNSMINAEAQFMTYHFDGSSR